MNTPGWAVARDAFLVLLAVAVLAMGVLAVSKGLPVWIFVIGTILSGAGLLLAVVAMCLDVFARPRGRGLPTAAVALIAATAATAAVLGCNAPLASADDLDPHIPNGAALWCQGGLGNVALIPYCDGLHYPDGSFWHQTAASPFGIGGPASLPWNAPILVKP